MFINTYNIKRKEVFITIQYIILTQTPQKDIPSSVVYIFI